MSPRLRSFRLAGDLFQELVSPAGILSPELGLELVVVGHELRFRKPGRVKFSADRSSTGTASPEGKTPCGPGGPAGGIRSAASRVGGATSG